MLKKGKGSQILKKTTKVKQFEKKKSLRGLKAQDDGEDNHQVYDNAFRMIKRAGSIHSKGRRASESFFSSVSESFQFKKSLQSRRQSFAPQDDMGSTAESFRLRTSSSVRSIATSISGVDSHMDERSLMKKFSFIPCLLMFKRWKIEMKYLEYYYSFNWLLVLFIGGFIGSIMVTGLVFVDTLNIDNKEFICPTLCYYFSVSGRYLTAASAYFLLLSSLAAIMLLLFKTKVRCINWKACVVIFNALFVLNFLVFNTGGFILVLFRKSISFSTFIAVVALQAAVSRNHVFLFFIANFLFGAILFVFKLIFSGINHPAGVVYSVGWLLLISGIVILHSYSQEKLLRGIFAKEQQLKRVNFYIKKEMRKGRALIKVIFPNFLIADVNKVLFSYEMDDMPHKVKYYASVVIAQYDICNFTKFSRSIRSARRLITIIDGYFSTLDKCCERFGVEKLSSDGDGILFGAFSERKHEAVCTCALEMLRLLNKKSMKKRSARCGIAKSWAYVNIRTNSSNGVSINIVGDAVKKAKIMEESSLPNRLKVSNELVARMTENSMFDFEEHTENGSLVVIDNREQMLLSVTMQNNIEEQFMAKRKNSKSSFCTSGTTASSNSLKMSKLVQKEILELENVSTPQLLKSLFCSFDVFRSKMNHFVSGGGSALNMLLQTCVSIFWMISTPHAKNLLGGYFDIVLHIPFVLASVILSLVFVAIVAWEKLFAKKSEKTGAILKVVLVWISYVNVVLTAGCFLITVIPLISQSAAVVFFDENESVQLDLIVQMLPISWPLAMGISHIPSYPFVLFFCLLGAVPIALYVLPYDIVEMTNYILFFAFSTSSSICNMYYFYDFDRNTRILTLSAENLSSEIGKNKIMINSVLSMEIAGKMMQNQKVSYQDVPICSACFLIMHNFENRLEKIETSTEQSFDCLSNFSCRDLFKLFNTLFTEIDLLIDINGCLRVKDISNGLIVMATHENRHVFQMINFTRSVVDLFNYYQSEEIEYKKCIEENNLFLTCGVHTGAMSLGIVGTLKVQLDCYGDTVNKTARLCQTCPRDEILVSEEFFKNYEDLIGFERSGMCVDDSMESELIYDVQFIENEKKNSLKGIGEVTSYFLRKAESLETDKGVVQKGKCEEGEEYIFKKSITSIHHVPQEEILKGYSFPN